MRRSPCLLLCGALLLLASPSSAAALQAVFGTDQFTGVETQDLAKVVLQAGDGGYFVMGLNQAKSKGQGPGDKLGTFIIKLTPAGQTSWIKVVTPNTKANPGTFVTSAEGGLWSGGQEAKSPRLTKYGSDGTVLWDRVLSTSEASGYRPVRIVEHTDGTVRVLMHNGTGLAMADFAKTGNPLGWHPIAGVFTGSAGVGSVRETNDGGFVATGVKDKALRLVKIGKEGTVAWDRTFPVGQDDAGHAVLEVSGGYLAGGFLQAKSGLAEVSLVKVDATGKQLWAQSLGGPNGYVAGLSLAQDGSYLVGGHKALPGERRVRLFLAKVDPSGHRLWEKLYGEAGAGGTVGTADGGVALIGETTAMGAKAIDIYFVKADAQGNAGAPPL